MLQFTRVDSIETTERGLEAALHGERLRIEPVRDDVVRIKLSRGGVFDDAPTHAVIADGHGGVHGRGQRQLRTAAAHRHAARGPVRDRRPPRRRHRRAGVHARVRDAQRRVRAPAPRRRGRRDLRPGGEGRTRQPAPSPVHALEHRHPQPDRRRRVRRQRRRHRVRPVLRRDPVLLPPHEGRAHGRLVHRQRLPRRVRLRRGARDPLRGRAVHGVRVRRPAHAGHPRGLHVAHGARRQAAAVGARLPPVPLVRLHAGRGRGARHAAPRARPAVRRAVAGHRVHGRLPRLHLEHGAVPRRARDAAAPGRAGLQGHHDHRPGRQVRARLRRLRPGDRAGRAVPHRGRRHLHRRGLAGRHRVPGLRHRGGPRVVGRAERRARAVRPGRHLERHERAGHGEHPARADAVRPRPRLPRALPQPVRAADGHGHGGRSEGGHAGEAHVRALARGLRRHPALRRELDGRQPGPLGPPVGEHPDGERLRRVRPAVRGRRRRRLPG